MSIPQDYSRRWKNGWFMTITKSSPRTHWLVGADSTFLLVLHLATTRWLFENGQNRSFARMKKRKAQHISAFLVSMLACQHTTVCVVEMGSGGGSPNQMWEEQMKSWGNFCYWDGHSHVKYPIFFRPVGMTKPSLAKASSVTDGCALLNKPYCWPTHWGALW